MPCTMCGGRDIDMTYSRPGPQGHAWRAYAVLHPRLDEHMDYRCRNCRFEWEEDCLNKEKKAQEEEISAREKSSPLPARRFHE